MYSIVGFMRCMVLMTTSSSILIPTSKIFSLAFLHYHKQQPPKQNLSRAITKPNVHSSSPRSVEMYMNRIGLNQEQEWYPMDPAFTTPQLISSLWLMIAQGCEMTKGDSNTVLFPNMEKEFSPLYLERLMHHFDVCKDVCDDFGVNLALLPHVQKQMGREKVVGFTVKSYRNPQKIGILPSDGNYKFAPDPMWDDEEDWGFIDQAVQEAVERDDGYHSDSDKEVDTQVSLSMNDNGINLDRVPKEDDSILTIVRKWVAKMMSDMGICPFTNGADFAGLPMGKVFYTIDRSSKAESMYARYWKEVVRLEQNSEKELSTTLLITPEFFLDDVELFDNFSNSLTQVLEPLKVEDLIQLVFFHPQWTFRDGGERSGVRAAANYARRSPWPMINILRTKQVRSAQRGIPTGLVYQQNEKTLNSIGVKKLESMLRTRDWSDIEGMKVNRRDMEALRIAQDLQETGVITQKDSSFRFDSLPAANKVSHRQLEGGNLINVILQALEKRLNTADANRNGKKLSGAETSAVMLASDFLLDHLKELENKPPTVVVSDKSLSFLDAYSDESDQFSSSLVSEEDEGSVLFGGGGIQMNSMDDDEFSSSLVSEDEGSVLFGGGGIQMNSMDDDLYSSGMDTRSFF